MARFAARFLLLAGLLLVLETSLWGWQSFSDIYTQTLANVAAGIYRSMGGDVHAVAGFLYSPRGETIQVVRQCSVFSLIALLVAALLAWPGTWRWKLSGIVAGAALLESTNVLRLVLLIGSAQNLPGYFPLIHREIAPVLLMLLALLWFLLWLRRQPTDAPQPA